MSPRGNVVGSRRPGSMRAAIEALAIGETYCAARRLAPADTGAEPVTRAYAALQSNVTSAAVRADGYRPGMFEFQRGEFRAQSGDLFVCLAVTRRADP